MKLKITIILFFFSIGLFYGYAQNSAGKKFDVQDFKEKRKEYIIKEVGLTKEEADQFFPLSEELLDKKYELNRAIRAKARELRQKQDATQAEYDLLVDNILDMHIKEAQLEKEYYQKFKKVLSSEKLYKFHRADKQFMRKTVNTDKGGRQQKGKK